MNRAHEPNGLVRRFAAVCLAWLVKLWARTWRLRWVGPASLAAPERAVYAFWHGQQMALVASPRPARLATLVSWSRDGALQAIVMRRLGLRVIRGSSSRGGVAGLLGMIRAVRSGGAAAFAVDGPRGPRGHAKAGAIAVAARSRALLIPVASAARRKLVLRRAWDAFEIPLPFTTVAIAVGAPLVLHEGVAGLETLRAAIDQERARAELACGASGRPGCASPLPTPSERIRPESG